MITVIYFWRISIKRVPQAIWHMATDRRVLKKNKSITFYKLIGTGTGQTFTPRDADPTLWGLIITIKSDDLSAFDSSPLLSAWRKFTKSEVRYIASPISSHGLWSGTSPFKEDRDLAKTWNGKVLAITRARIRFRKNFRFWQAVPPVIASLHECPGVESAIGIGEAPIGLQGTFSVWKDNQALKDFAYSSSAHVGAIRQTQLQNWYSEELFARFALLEVRDSINSFK
jgi:hypothetical protein